ncbi:MAG: UDP-glucose 4-epimerase GalE [Acidobacteria bacterium]|nr:MAG: UDP-glucose 4-epimerase GalE [Acidobacteriota bacterium]PYY22850.1 MAG: UDP-glucose 4-epimerase GalE [Acidobacteriota bacterium]
MKILVTGGAGYVGSVCSAQLLQRGHAVTVVDDLSTGHREAVPASADFHRLDIGDKRAVLELFSKKRFDAVFHFAAKALIPESVTNPGTFFDKNLVSGIVFLECLRRASIGNFIFSSTAAVYGNPVRIPIREDDPKEPMNAYGESKLALERILRWYCSAYGWSVVAFRYFNASGSIPGHGERHQPETHILPLLLQVASGRRDFFEIYGTQHATPDGTCLRDYVHVLDIAEAHVLALSRLDLPGFRAFNLGTGTSHSVREVCRAVEQVTGQHLKIRTGAARPGDPAVLCASPEVIRAELGWKAVHSNLLEIVRSAWLWEQAQCNSAVLCESSRSELH